MLRFKRILFAAVLIVLSAALPVYAQEGDGLPDDQQALLDQLRAAAADLEGLDSFVTTSSGTMTADQIVTIGEEQAAGNQYTSLNRVTSFTHDAEGAANAQSVFDVETTQQALGESEVVTTTLHAEARLVGGVLFVRAEAETSEGAEPPLLPEGWVQVTSADEWPALDVLSLDRILENPTDPALFDNTFYTMLDHASEVWSDAPEGGDLRQIGVRVTGNDLVAALSELAQADGESDARAALYALMTDANWEITAELDEAGQIQRMRSEAFLQWTDLDLTTLQPTAPDGSLLTQYILNESELVLSEVNVPREPVEAPALGES